MASSSRHNIGFPRTLTIGHRIAGRGHKFDLRGGKVNPRPGAGSERSRRRDFLHRFSRGPHIALTRGV